MKQQELLSRVERILLDEEKRTGHVASPKAIQAILEQEGVCETLGHVSDAMRIVRKALAEAQDQPRADP